jgi:hypothetical protein
MQANPEKEQVGLPKCAADYIDQVVRHMRYRKRVRAEVREELRAHFEDGLSDCADAGQREARARELIEEFGDAKLLAVLCRRAKKRCRPLWRKVVVRTMQGILVLLAYMVLCALPLFLGRPTIRVNYVEWLNDHWRPEGKDVVNAAVYYEQAAKLYVEPPEPIERKIATARPELQDFNDVELKLLTKWLNENAQALSKFRKGANTADYWPVYDTNESNLRDPNFVDRATSDLTAYRHLVFALVYEIAEEVRQGKLREAFDDCFVLRKTGRHLQDRGLLLEQLVGIAIENVAYLRMFDILYKNSIPPEMLARVQEQLLADYDEHRRVVNLAGEKAIWYDCIQRTFTDDGKGGGHALRNGFPFAAGDWRSNLLGVFLFDYPDRCETRAMVDRFFEEAQASLATPPYEKEAKPSSTGEGDIPFDNMLLTLLPPAYRQAGQQVWALKTQEAAIITTVAILRYRSDKGEYPVNLEALVADGYLSALPEDPFGKGPLSYRRTDDGFVLYSWGENLVDNGGVQGLDRKGKPRMWAGDGDWVFWPVWEPEAKP